MDKLYLTWEQFDFAIETIRDMLIARDKMREILRIYGIPRGGLPLAVALSHRLQLPLATTEEFLKGGCTLLVDDISDSGNTLMRLAPLASVTATIHVVPGTKFTPDVHVFSRPRGVWMIYPWEGRYDRG